MATKKVVNKRKKKEEPMSAPVDKATTTVEELEKLHKEDKETLMEGIEKHEEIIKLMDNAMDNDIVFQNLIEGGGEEIVSDVAHELAGEKAFDGLVVGVDLAKGEDMSVVMSEEDKKHLLSSKQISNAKQLFNERVAGSTEKNPVNIKEVTTGFILNVSEATVNIAGSTPARDFAVSMCKYFEEHPNSCLRVRYIGAGSGQQLTKATIEANKLLIPRGQMISRYDFWTNENDKSVNNVRLLVVDIMPNSLSQALSGQNVNYIPLEAFLNKEGAK